MYIPGRLRTGSSPCNTWMDPASYAPSSLPVDAEDELTARTCTFRPASRGVAEIIASPFGHHPSLAPALAPAHLTVVSTLRALNPLRANPAPIALARHIVAPSTRRSPLVATLARVLVVVVVPDLARVPVVLARVPVVPVAPDPIPRVHDVRIDPRPRVSRHHRPSRRRATTARAPRGRTNERMIARSV
jgi:hypothetical protein